MSSVLSTHQHELIHDASVGLGSLSALVSLLVIYVHVRLRLSKRPRDDPVLWLSVVCFFAPLSNMGIGRRSDPLCAMEAVANQFFYLASFLWVSCIAHQLYGVIVWSRTLHFRENMPVYHVFSWGIPSATVSLLLFLGQVQTDSSAEYDWCWIRPGPWRFALFYIPLIILLVLNALAYINISVTVYRRYRQNLLEAGQATPSSLGSRLLTLNWGLRASLYLFVFVVTRTGSIANRFQELAHPENPIFALRMMHVVTQSLQGVLYGIVYFMNESVGRRLIDLIRRRLRGEEEDQMGMIPAQDFAFPYEQDSAETTSIYDWNRQWDEDSEVSD
uniref:G-protein coupled receptors family 2 profile 2 domain-containing protein n=2 Tax=Compsopogon caeruleus TaxID=31354 RepID=A0A7S1TA08_9RHOD|mmetsp:Transcript_14005/g.28684  ORF Transcript_14005/g.28684 Transcript_14005/m.28684 type:complete len:331 (+) Transcript_14005:129-1121(+)